MTASPGSAVETPSGKDADYENFPVGSWLLPAHLRPHIARYYRFARAIDDIADNPDLSPETKIERLDGFEEGVLGKGDRSGDYQTAHEMHESLLATRVTPKHCTDLIAAFKQDAVKSRYQNWDQLVDYCLLSAAPVGRYLIDLHGGSLRGYGPSDALCIALQIINHLQDCKEDYLDMNRVYIPLDYLEAEGVSVEALAGRATEPALRRVLDRVIADTQKLMPEADRLPAGLSSRRLAMESQSIVLIAHRLLDLLRHGDPLAARVKLSKPGYAVCCLRGILQALLMRLPSP